MRLADVAVSQGRVTATLPPQSITLFVVPRSGGNVPPIAYPSCFPATGTSPLTVACSGSLSNDPDGTIVAYAWDFGDGATATGSSVSHTYTTGTYQARLTVTDDDGATGSNALTVTVSPPPNTVDAPTNLTAGVSGKTVTLRWTDKSANEDGFYVERGVSAKKTTTWTRVGTLPANTTTFAQTVTSGTWLYRVQAFRTAGVVSGYSNQVTVRVR